MGWKGNEITLHLFSNLHRISGNLSIGWTIFVHRIIYSAFHYSKIEEPMNFTAEIDVMPLKRIAGPAR